MNGCKGQTNIISFMLGIVFIILGLALMFPINQVITGDDVMGEDGLDCSNPNITNQDKGICYQTDSFNFLVPGVIIGLGVILIGRVVL